MDELKAIVASNIIRFRTQMGLTQAQLGDAINYSDKSISKWERAEALPDLYVLKKLSKLFGVSIDTLTTEQTETEPQLHNVQVEKEISTRAITSVAIVSIWTMATLAFVLLWIFDIVMWQIFIAAIPLSLIALLIFHTVWEGGKCNKYIIAALVASIFLTVYLIFLKVNLWKLFLILAPAEALVFLSFRIKRRRKDAQ